MFLHLQHENPPSLFAMLKSAGRFFYGTLQQNISSPRSTTCLYPLLTIPKDRHIFKNGASFDRALNMYRFDSQLRTMMFSQKQRKKITPKSNSNTVR